MAHFSPPTSPSSSTPEKHYIFGPPTSFYATCSDLDIEPLGEIEMTSEVSERGDKGTPVVVQGGKGSEGEKRVRDAFVDLAATVWNKIE
jgi:hypothetical protein